MKFKELILAIGNDLDVYTNKRSSIFIKIIVFFTNPSFQLLANYRISNYLKETPFSFLNIFIRYINNWFMSSEISPYATLGKNIQFPHLNGIVIDYGSIIKDNVIIFQQITIGAQGGTKNNEKKYPIIEENVTIYAKASLIGAINIAKYTIIGAHSLVLANTEENGIYVGIPAKKVSNV